MGLRSVTRPPGIIDDSLQLLDFLLCPAKGAELLPNPPGILSALDRNEASRVDRVKEICCKSTDCTNPLLGQLPCSLVLAVSQQFDDTAFIRGQTKVPSQSHVPKERTRKVSPRVSTCSSQMEATQTGSVRPAVSSTAEACCIGQ